MKNALMDEEWAAQLKRSPSELRDLLLYAKDEVDAEGWLTIHGLGALCLHGQDFGFTREDVQIVGDVAEYLSDDADNHEITGADALRVQDLADRIEALLPPETKDLPSSG